MADVRATDLTQETAATLNGSEQLVMFDAAEGKRCTIDDLFAFLRLAKGCMAYKNIRCNNTSESSEKTGYNFKQEVTWPTMGANDFILGAITAGNYNSRWAAENAAGKLTLYFTTRPANNVYINIYRIGVTAE